MENNKYRKINFLIMLKELHQILGSITKALDIIYVIENVKPVSRVISTEGLLKFLEKKGLQFSESDFKIRTIHNTTESYTDKGVKLEKGEEGKSLLYISKSKKLANDAKMLESENNHTELGKLLGYPECCCKFFQKYFSEKNTDLTEFSFRESKGHKFPWQNNNCMRVFDISLISHFPCSFNCLETKKIADKNLEIVNKYDSDIAGYYSFALKTAVLYAHAVGVYSFPNSIFSDNTLKYKKIIPSAKNDLYSMIKTRNRIKIIDRNHFLVNEVSVKDPQTFLGIFS